MFGIDGLQPPNFLQPSLLCSALYSPSAGEREKGVSISLTTLPRLAFRPAPPSGAEHCPAFLVRCRSEGLAPHLIVACRADALSPRLGECGEDESAVPPHLAGLMNAPGESQMDQTAVYPSAIATHHSASPSPAKPAPRRTCSAASVRLRGGVGSSVSSHDACDSMECGDAVDVASAALLRRLHGNTRRREHTLLRYWHAEGGDDADFHGSRVIWSAAVDASGAVVAVVKVLVVPTFVFIEYLVGLHTGSAAARWLLLCVLRDLVGSSELELRLQVDTVHAADAHGMYSSQLLLTAFDWKDRERDGVHTVFMRGGLTDSIAALQARLQRKHHAAGHSLRMAQRCSDRGGGGGLRSVAMPRAAARLANTRLSATARDEAYVSVGSLPSLPSCSGAAGTVYRAGKDRVQHVLEMRCAEPSSAAFLQQWLPEWFLQSTSLPVTVVYLIRAGMWTPTLLVAESLYLICFHAVRDQNGHARPVSGAAGLYPLVTHCDELPSYEGRVHGEEYETEHAAAEAAASLSSDHAITWRLPSGAFVVLDGAAARSGGSQNINDVVGTTLVPSVLIHLDRRITQEVAFTPITANMTIRQLAVAEVLTDYGQRFWRARRGSQSTLCTPADVLPEHQPSVSLAAARAVRSRDAAVLFGAVTASRPYPAATRRRAIAPGEVRTWRRRDESRDDAMSYFFPIGRVHPRQLTAVARSADFASVAAADDLSTASAAAASGAVPASSVAASAATTSSDLVGNTAGATNVSTATPCCHAASSGASCSVATAAAACASIAVSSCHAVSAATSHSVAATSSTLTSFAAAIGPAAIASPLLTTNTATAGHAASASISLSASADIASQPTAAPPRHTYDARPAHTNSSTLAVVAAAATDSVHAASSSSNLATSDEAAHSTAASSTATIASVHPRDAASPAPAASAPASSAASAPGDLLPLAPPRLLPPPPPFLPGPVSGASRHGVVAGRWARLMCEPQQPHALPALRPPALAPPAAPVPPPRLSEDARGRMVSTRRGLAAGRWPRMMVSPLHQKPDRRIMSPRNADVSVTLPVLAVRLPASGVSHPPGAAGLGESMCVPPPVLPLLRAPQLWVRTVPALQLSTSPTPRLAFEPQRLSRGQRGGDCGVSSIAAASQGGASGDARASVGPSAPCKSGSGGGSDAWCAAAYGYDLDDDALAAAADAAIAEQRHSLGSRTLRRPCSSAVGAPVTEANAQLFDGGAPLGTGDAVPSGGTSACASALHHTSSASGDAYGPSAPVHVEAGATWASSSAMRLAPVFLPSPDVHSAAASQPPGGWATITQRDPGGSTMRRESDWFDSELADEDEVLGAALRVDASSPTPPSTEGGSSRSDPESGGESVCCGDADAVCPPPRCTPRHAAYSAASAVRAASAGGMDMLERVSEWAAEHVVRFAVPAGADGWRTVAAADDSVCNDDLITWLQACEHRVLTFLCDLHCPCAGVGCACHARAAAVRQRVVDQHGPWELQPWRPRAMAGGELRQDLAYGTRRGQCHTCGRVVLAATGGGAVPARCASCTSNRASCAAPADDTQSLIRAIVGDAVVAPDVPEALLMWNAAGWYCGPLARAKPAVVMRSQRRYDVLGSLLVGSGAPTYLAVTEVNGSSTDFRSPHGLHAWLSSRGYASVILPGPVSKSIHAVKGRLGGSVLAWRVDTVQLVGAAPSADPDSATLSAVYRHRRQCGHGVPPVRVGVVYGSHRRNGKAKAVQMVTMHAMRDEGVIMAGDYNVTPADGFQAAGRRRVQADTLFATLTGDGRPQSSLSLAAVVPLGHDHARGEHSRVCRTPRAVNSCSDGRGMPASDARVYMGTSTIDHAVVAGHERLAWSLQSRWLVCDGEGLVSDHEIIVVQRQPRSVVTDGRGIYRLPRYCLSKWTPKQHASYCAEIERAMRECTVAVDDREHAMGQLVSIALRAADVAISPITHRTAHQVARIGHAGGDASGLASQVARVRGVLDVVQRAARTSDAADAALNAATVGNSTYAIACRLRARAALADAAAREGLLYDARAAQYVGRHNRFLRGALSLRTATSAPSTYSQVLPVRRAVVSRLQRELQYYGGKHSVLRRRQDEPVIRGVQAARDAPDPAAARDAIIQAMSQRSQRGQHGIRGFYTGDDAARGTWVGEAAATRRGIGEIYRAIDDDNHGHGVCAERVVGFFSAFCSDMWPELCAHDGDAWTLPAVCAFPDYQRSLSQLHGDKAVSLDRISKEMIEAAPTAFQHLCYQASMAIATPHDDGSRSQPALWSRIPVQCLDKKKPSDEIKKKRDIALPSQMMKQQANLYFPAYSAVMPRLHGGNFGWTRGVAPRGAAMVASYAMDHAHLLRHLLIVVYADIQRFFPAMDRDFLILAQQWYGLPADVREATRSLYENACMLYETAHGLADFCFDTLHMTTGRVQGCRLSTEEAKIFLSSLAEAIDVVAGGSGVRFWCGAGEGTRRIASVFCADDVAGMLTSWSGSSAFVAILDEWATVSASVCGIDLKECSKTTYSALSWSRQTAHLQRRCSQMIASSSYMASSCRVFPFPALTHMLATDAA